MSEIKNIEVVALSEVLEYLGIDETDDTIESNISRMIRTADATLKGSIGEDYPRADPRSKELALIIISDLYDNRSFTSISGNVRRLVEDMSLQLRLELRRSVDK